ncbi:phosrestin-1-like [Photinus pyralis]|uniref:phosrestin-1-like n=1 Tax=Photinus pyralis TaxID=7054 RepID=UPI0012675F66|nr:phosrestin-1-like [Photinus pyralis]
MKKVSKEALLKRLGPNAYPFSMEITPLAPPSVQLVPAKEYSGAPIGTSYDVRAYIAEKLDEKLHRRTTVRMGIRVVQRAAAPPSPYIFNPANIGQHLPKQRSKNGHKIPLFACKSVPLTSNIATHNLDEDRKPSSGTDARNVKLNLKNESESSNGRNIEKELSPENECKVEAENNPDSDVMDCLLARSETEQYTKNKSSPEGISGNRTPTHVSFKDQLTNGLDSTECHTSHINESGSNVDEKENIQKQIGFSQDNNKKNQIEKFEPPCGGKRPSLAAFLAQVPPPHAVVEKPFLLSDGRIELEASLDKAIYSHGEEIEITLQVRNLSSKTVKRIKVFVVQHVDVCMFSNGKFKNVVASTTVKDNCPVASGSTVTQTYNLIPTKSSTKNWIALEDSYTKTGTSLASTVTSACDNPQDRNVFAIYVTYYVKVKLIVSLMGGELSLKLPFTLMHTCSEFDPTWTKELESPRAETQEKSTPEEIKPGIGET